MYTDHSTQIYIFSNGAESLKWRGRRETLIGGWGSTFWRSGTLWIVSIVTPVLSIFANYSLVKDRGSICCIVSMRSNYLIWSENWTNIFVGNKVILYTLVLSKYINQMLPSKLNRWFLFWIICQIFYSFKGKVTPNFLVFKFE